MENRIVHPLQASQNEKARNSSKHQMSKYRSLVIILVIPMTPSPQPSEDALKQRILSHMSRDHKLALKDYLAYYGGIWLGSRGSLELVDISVSKLMLNYYRIPTQIHTTTIPINPVLANLGEARDRLIRMAFEAADGLHLSPYSISKWPVPKSPLSYIFATLLAALSIASIAPSSVTKLLGTRYPGFLRFILTHSRWITAFTLLAHASEYFLLLRPKLDFYRVGGYVRWAWFTSCIFEGFPSLQRFNKEAEKLTIRRQEIESKLKKDHVD